MELYGIKPIYRVGGCVRDMILGIEPNDVDYTTPMSPEEMTEIIKAHGKRVYGIGARFGTIGFKHEGQVVEVTTFRSEKYEEGNRRPTVEFVDNLIDDLARRDFTINAMAEADGTVIDPFGGQDDLTNGIIRAVGNPDKRYKEDPLRMLRAIRFASRFDFEIDERTFAMIQEKAYRILHVSKERWMMEIDKMLAINPVRSMALVMKSHLMKYIIPEMSLQENYDQNNPHHKYNLWEHTLQVLNKYHESGGRDLNMMWAILLHDVGKPFVRVDKVDRSSYPKHDLVSAEIADSLAVKLKWSKERRQTVVDLVRNHMDEDSPLKPFDREGKT